MSSEPPRVAFRVDGDAHRGMGHLSMCFSIGSLLQRELSAQIDFLTLETSLHNSFVGEMRDRGFTFSTVNGGEPSREDPSITQSHLMRLQPSLVVTDLLTVDPDDQDLLDNPDIEIMQVGEYISWVRDLGIPVLSVTYDTTEVTFGPDILLAPHPAQLDVSYPDDGAMRLLGPGYFVLGPDFSPFLKLERAIAAVPRKVVVIFGGSDPEQQTLKAGHALAGLDGIEIVAVHGLGAAERAATHTALGSLGIKTVAPVRDLAALLWEADLVVTAGGNLLFELAALGTPAVVLSTRQRQARNADWFDRAGAVVHMGLGSGVSEAALREAVLSLLSDPDRRLALSEAGRSAVNGRGSERVCAEVRQVLS